MRAALLAGAASGVGKTTLTLGLLRALRERGVEAAGAKSGPDYIDPTLHEAACGRPSFNLDAWAMPPALLRALLARAGDGGRAVLVEGAMGLFDGGPGGVGSSASLAAALGLPVVLVFDARGQAQSAGALARGFAEEAEEAGARLAGAVAMRAGGARHRALLEEALARRGVPLLGAVREDAAMRLPSRHLGLVPAREEAGTEAAVRRAAERVAEDVDLSALEEILESGTAAKAPGDPAAAGAAADADDPAPVDPAADAAGERAPDATAAAPAAEAPGAVLRRLLPAPDAEIAVAQDDAFVFAYPHLLEAWRESGARVRLFSPLADEAPPPGAGFVFLPGGYPELHAARLEAAGRFQAGLRRAAAEGARVHGECGGYMALGDGLEDASGERRRMAGLLPLETSFARRRLRLGYRALEPADGAAPLAPVDADGGAPGADGGAPGAPVGAWRGHEFHHSTTTREGAGEGGARALFRAADAAGRDLGAEGLRRGAVSGSFAHLVAPAP